MAMLIDNRPTEPTEPGEQLVPPDLQDPCKDLIELRLEKVWRADEPEERPKEVVFHITRTYQVNGETIQDAEFHEQIILKPEDAIAEDVWEKLLSGSQYTAYHVGKDGTPYYYTYHITEDAIDGYTTEITYQGEHQYNITVINRKKWFEQVLPETGGSGVVLDLRSRTFCFWQFMASMEYRKRRCRKTESL